jgi:hypothetical protein
MSSESESFLGLKPSPDGNPSAPDADAPRGRFTLLTVTWIIALVATSPDPRGVVLLPFFPSGLMMIFRSEPKSVGDFVLVWLVYAVLSTCVLLTHRKFWFYLVYGVLVVMLLTNVVGCHMFMHAMSGVH